MGRDCVEVGMIVSQMQNLQLREGLEGCGLGYL